MLVATTRDSVAVRYRAIVQTRCIINRLSSGRYAIQTIAMEGLDVGLEEGVFRCGEIPVVLLGADGELEIFFRY